MLLTISSSLNRTPLFRLGLPFVFSYVKRFLHFWQHLSLFWEYLLLVWNVCCGGQPCSPCSVFSLLVVVLVIAFQLSLHVYEHIESSCPVLFSCVYVVLHGCLVHVIRMFSYELGWPDVFLLWLSGSPLEAVTVLRFEVSPQLRRDVPISWAELAKYIFVIR